MTTTCKLDVSKTIVVVGRQVEEVSKAAISFDENVVIVEQKEQLGTGHAVREAMPELLEHTGNVIILYGDVPFISSSTIKKMIEKKNIGSDIVIAGFKAQHPGEYGRIVLENEKIIKIIEAKDATKDELANNLCNSGIILSNSRNLHELTKLLKNENAKEEFYLTDIIEIANNQGQICSLVPVSYTHLRAHET